METSKPMSALATIFVTLNEVISALNPIALEMSLMPLLAAFSAST